MITLQTIRDSWIILGSQKIKNNKKHGYLLLGHIKYYSFSNMTLKFLRIFFKPETT